MQVEVAVEEACHMQQERRDVEEEEAPAVEKGGRIRSPIDQFGHSLLLEPRRA